MQVLVPILTAPPQKHFDQSLKSVHPPLTEINLKAKVETPTILALVLALVLLNFWFHGYTSCHNSSRSMSANIRTLPYQHITALLWDIVFINFTWTVLSIAILGLTAFSLTI